MKVTGHQQPKPSVASKQSKLVLQWGLFTTHKQQPKPPADPISPKPMAMSPAPPVPPDLTAIGAEIGRILVSNALYSAVYDSRDLIKSSSGILSLKTVQDLPPSRKRFKDHEIDSILRAVAATGLQEGLSQSKTIKRLKLQPGYETLSESQVKRWKRKAKRAAAESEAARGKKVQKIEKRGRKPASVEFEQAVRERLIYSALEKSDSSSSSSKQVVVANICHSYAVIKCAAIAVQALPEWKDNQRVQALTFSAPWICDFLRRSTLRRRRITATEKKVPPKEEIQNRMAEIQARIASGAFAPDEIISADETGIFFGAAPKNQYIPPDAERASAPESNEKARFTALLWGTAGGKMGPAWLIIKCSVARADLSSVRVLKDLHLKPGFTVDDDWKLGIWKRELTLKVKNKEVTQTYIRPFLYHPASLTVITVQHKAWMDTPGICMWLDVQMKAWVDRKRGKALVVWDNCGPHKVAAVQSVASEVNVTTEELPVNTTDRLQVMDLVVNGPMKAGIRNARAMALYNYFQSWRIARMSAEINHKPLPPFAPPKPTVEDGLRTLLEVIDTNLATSAFQKSMVKTFVQVLLLKDQKTQQYMKYSGKGKGSLIVGGIPKEEESDDTSCTFADLAVDVAVVNKEVDEEGEPVEGEEEEGEGEESDESETE